LSKQIAYAINPTSLWHTKTEMSDKRINYIIITLIHLLIEICSLSNTLFQLIQNLSNLHLSFVMDQLSRAFSVLVQWQYIKIDL